MWPASGVSSRGGSCLEPLLYCTPGAPDTPGFTLRAWRPLEKIVHQLWVGCCLRLLACKTLCALATLPNMWLPCLCILPCIGVACMEVWWVLA